MSFTRSFSRTSSTTRDVAEKDENAVGKGSGGSGAEKKPSATGDEAGSEESGRGFRGIFRKSKSRAEDAVGD